MGQFDTQDAQFQRIKDILVKQDINMSDESIRENLELFLPNIESTFFICRLADELIELEERY